MKVGSVVVAHPEMQHSHQLAAALCSAGLLSRFIHGAEIPTYVGHEIGHSLRQRVQWYQPIRRMLPYVLPRKQAAVAQTQLLRSYDAWIARRVPSLDCRAIVAYENSAMRSFEAAKRCGKICILDAANVHHQLQTRWLPDSNTPETKAIKDREVELADVILTCSSLARDSYLCAGVAPNKVHSVPLGVDLGVFSGQCVAQRAKREGSIVFCNAGLLDLRKGMDLIADACRALRSSQYQFEFLIAGNVSTGDVRLVEQLNKVARIQARVPHVDLPKFFALADVFVLPSRIDSFGMVVSEALACGLPVIVTENVGAKDLVCEGVSGWIIPPANADALTQRMMWCAANPNAVRAMVPAARASAEARSWQAYRREVAAIVGEVVRVGS